MKVKREKHRAAIALPGAFFDVGGEERRRMPGDAPPHVGVHAGGGREEGQNPAAAERAEGQNPAAGM